MPLNELGYSMGNEPHSSGMRLAPAGNLATILLAASLVSMAVLPALAQPTFGSVESVETMVANATTVVVGRLSMIDVTYDEHHRGFPVELTVEETLKGDRAPRIAVAIPGVNETTL